MSLKDDILDADDIKYEVVPTPEWAPKVTAVVVRTLTAAERDEFEGAILVEKREKRKGKVRTRHQVSTLMMRAKLCVRAICVGVGNPARLFEDGDTEALANKSSACVDRIFEKAQQLCAFSDDDADELGKA